MSSVQGLGAVFAAMEAVNTRRAEKVNTAIQGAGIECEALAKQNCPVDTGRLRSSIKYTPDNLSCTVWTNVNYAMFVEHGTRKTRAQPFLYPAYALAKQHLFEELKNT